LALFWGLRSAALSLELNGKGTADVGVSTVFGFFFTSTLRSSGATFGREDGSFFGSVELAKSENLCSTFLNKIFK
jgi:hypothetical protein